MLISEVNPAGPHVEAGRTLWLLAEVCRWTEEDKAAAVMLGIKTSFMQRCYCSSAPFNTNLVGPRHAEDPLLCSLPSIGKTMGSTKQSIQTLSVVVPANPFLKAELQGKNHCLAALNVEKLMEWWPGTPHAPHRNSSKVRAIQRSLDWRRVVQIAAYLLQSEVVDAPDRVDDYFRDIYEPRKREPGREWPPKLPRVVGYERSEYPAFSNILIHVNGAKIEQLYKAVGISGIASNAAKLVFDEQDDKLNFSVIDGQHRVNGAYLAVKILGETRQHVEWDIPTEVFLDLDKRDEPPRRQAQIFIDVNFYQKKVDRSLVADLFPTARGPRTALDDKERAQDLGRKLMLEVGPLVGMIQIPGIKYGVKDVVTLATLNQAIEDALPHMLKADIDSLDLQASFLAQCLEAWLNATGRRIDGSDAKQLDPSNVAYQGRVVVSFLTLIPACIWKLKKQKGLFVSSKSLSILESWLKEVMKHAGLLRDERFLDKAEFKEKGFLGSGGLGRFRDVLWAAAISEERVDRLAQSSIVKKAATNRHTILGAAEES